MLTVESLLQLWNARERDAGPQKARDRETLEYMEGRVAVPLPEIDSNERAAVANLMAQGMTALAQRIASTRPTPVFPAGPSKAANARARQKRKALVGMWDQNQLHIQRRQRARWMLAYASAPVIVRPHWSHGEWAVKWDVRSPLSAYPAPTPAHLDMEPPDMIFPTSQAASKVERKWPHKTGELRALRKYDPKNPTDHKLTLIEFFGPDEYVCAVVGKCDPYDTSTYVSTPTNEGKWIVELERVDNRIGRCMAIAPNSIALEDPIGQYEGMKGLYQMKAKLMALEYRYVANSVDPPIWFVESENGGAIIQMADGPAGVPGHVRGMNVVPVNPPPGVATNNMMDRLEREARVEGGVSPDLGGESGSNIRTGRRGQDILSAVQDFPIQEAHDLFAHSQWLEDRLAMDCAREWFGGMKRTWGGFEFDPAKTFDKGDWHDVSYALAGADANGQVIRMGQLQGTGLISKHTARMLIPDIADAEFEDDMVTAEQINDGILAEFMQPGSFGLPDKARVMQLVRDDKESLADAIMRVQREAQERQATTTGVVDAGAPEAQPGIVPPGAGAEAAAVGPAPDLAGLTSLLGALRLGQRAAPQEQVAEAQAAV